MNRITGLSPSLHSSAMTAQRIVPRYDEDLLGAVVGYADTYEGAVVVLHRLLAEHRGEKSFSAPIQNVDDQYLIREIIPAHEMIRAMRAEQEELETVIRDLRSELSNHKSQKQDSVIAHESKREVLDIVRKIKAKAKRNIISTCAGSVVEAILFGAPTLGLGLVKTIGCTFLAVRDHNKLIKRCRMLENGILDM